MDADKEQRRAKYFSKVRRRIRNKPVMVHPLKTIYDRNEIKKEFSKLIREELHEE